MTRIEIVQSDIHQQHPVRLFTDFFSVHSNGENFGLWRKFNPANHRRILKWLMVLKEANIQGETKYQYSISGTGLDDLFEAHKYQGHYLEECHSETDFKIKLTELERCRLGKGPVYSRSRNLIPGKEYISFVRGIFPFIRPDKHFNYVIIMAPEDTIIS